MSVLQHAANLCLRILGNLHAGSDVPVHVVVPWVSGLAQDRDYGRSTVVTDRGIVATSQVLASRAGADEPKAMPKE
jgi:hypothetical protein